MRIRKNVGLEDRLSQADIKARGALDVFEKAAVDLDVAAEEADAVLLEAEAEVAEALEKVERLRQVRDTAYARAAAHRTKAEKIREFAK